MIEAWLNHILHSSSYLYKKKRGLLTDSISMCILNSLIIVAVEVYLAIISLPIFLFVPEKHVEAKYRTQEKSSYKLSFANLMIITGAILLIISFYNVFSFFPVFILGLIILEIFLFFLYAIYSKRWTEMTLKISSFIFSKKQKLLESTKKLQSIILSFYIVILELILLFVSLPVYVFIKQDTLQKIEGEKFKLRRKITLAYLGFFIFIILLQVICALMIFYYMYPPQAASFN